MIRFAGHPVHVALVHVPLGLCPAALVWSVVAAINGAPHWWVVSYWTLGLGLAAAAPTVATGLLDFGALRGAKAQAAGVRHLMWMASALTVLIAGFLVRGGTAPPGSPAAVIALDAIGTGLMLIGGWQGGELVLRHRAGATSDGDVDSTPPAT